MASAKHKVYRPGVGKYLLLMGAMYLVYGLGFLYGFAVYRKIPAFDPMKMPYLYVLAGAGAVLLIFSLLALFLNLNKKITVTPESLIYEHGSKQFNVTWKELVYKAPENERGIYRSTLISDGKQFGSFDNLFFKDYDFILEFIVMAKESKSGSVMKV
jgi:hypothetical protein